MSMSSSSHQYYLVPKWNMKQQRRQEQDHQQLQLEDPIIITESSQPPSTNHLPPMSNNYDEIAELTWENGQISMHGLSGLAPTSQAKPTWVNRAHDTLESIVEQATCNNKKSKLSIKDNHGYVPTNSNVASSSGEHHQMVVPTLSRKRSHFDQRDVNYVSINNTNKKMLLEEEHTNTNNRKCVSASATFCRDNNDITTMMTWPSLDSAPRTFNHHKILEEDSACHSGSEIGNNANDRDSNGKGERVQSKSSSRRNRTAAVHNQSERRRRDRINEKMKALQKLVPNANKTDKASMLDEVIRYLKQLQAQIEMMMSLSVMSMPQMMMMQQQQQLQMSSMIAAARSSMASNNTTPNPVIRPPSFPPQLIQPTTTIGGAANPMMFLAPSFMMPSNTTNAASIHLPSASSSYGNGTTTFPQPLNMDLFNNMAAFYSQQQMNHHHNNQIKP
ncbi:hypothetical protein PIB30_059737 [Stylosanthes scabra]|uniref:BHLH domain-containing protein n=1 Tax=Stylosanthes scabra TaxID=79078 RepID=A0ABU6UJR8_9FABA|nr:hypothetical protein [Stylosanthes scabra]